MLMISFQIQLDPAPWLDHVIFGVVIQLLMLPNLCPVDHGLPNELRSLRGANNPSLSVALFFPNATTI